ncbi:CatB-related O-acetyltransferase [Albidovulum sp.]|jgi:virginiamycin A acetyltransferase|uniref:CatB-related O-acetyltransferase n=1 Tax=Albidovulum sp. TaxID=1872424 RepID=UPI003033408B
MPRLPDATARHPLVFPDGTVHRQLVNLAAVIDHPNWQVGRHAYANDFDPPEDWAARLAPYLYAGASERLVLGPFCQVAHGARFITASANHPMDGLTTYPFSIFDRDAIALYRGGFTGLPDTVIGPDCWIGHGALILPGARLGAGVIVGAGAVVSGTVPPYAVVAGNPARILRRRFAEAEVGMLLDLAWWDWPDDALAAAMPHLAAGDIAALARQKPA